MVVAVTMVVQLTDAGVRVWKRAREDEGGREGERAQGRRIDCILVGQTRRETRMDAAAV